MAFTAFRRLLLKRTGVYYNRSNYYKHVTLPIFHVNFRAAVVGRLVKDVDLTRRISTDSYGYSFYDKCGGDLLWPDEEVEPQSRDVVVLRIARWLDCSYDEATNIMCQMPQLRSAHLESMDNHVKFLKQYGVNETLLRENPWLLTMSISTLRPRLQLISQIGVNSNTAALLKLGRNRIRRFVKKPSAKVDNRISYLAEMCQCTNAEINRHIRGDLKSILTMQYGKLVDIMQFLLKNGVAPTDIKDDLWIFRHPIGCIRSHMERIKAADIVPTKLWMLHCPDDQLEEILYRRSVCATILGDATSKIDYFTKRLGCYTREDVDRLLERCPSLKSLSIIKMKKAFDALYAMGITPKQIYRYPSILARRMERVEARVREMRKLGLEPSPLHVVCFSQDRYKSLLERRLMSISKTNGTPTKIDRLSCYSG